MTTATQQRTTVGISEADARRLVGEALRMDDLQVHRVETSESGYSLFVDTNVRSIDVAALQRLTASPAFMGVAWGSIAVANSRTEGGLVFIFEAAGV